MIAEVDLLELFEKHAASKAEAKRVFKLVEKHNILELDLNTMFGIKGIGRKAALLIVEVAADLRGKK